MVPLCENNLQPSNILLLGYMFYNLFLGCILKKFLIKILFICFRISPLLARDWLLNLHCKPIALWYLLKLFTLLILLIAYEWPAAPVASFRLSKRAHGISMTNYKKMKTMFLLVPFFIRIRLLFVCGALKTSWALIVVLKAH